MRREFPKRFRENPDGTWRCKLRTKEEAQRFGQMSAKAFEMETAKSLERAHSTPMVRAADKHGRRVWLVADKAERELRRGGLKYISKIGGLRVIVEHGPDGMLFKLEKDEWVPTGRTALSLLSPEVSGIQRDPDGFPWRKIRGNWRRLG